LRVITKNINEPNARAFYDRGYDVHAIDVNKGYIHTKKRKEKKKEKNINECN